MEWSPTQPAGLAPADQPVEPGLTGDGAWVAVDDLATIASTRDNARRNRFPPLVRAGLFGAMPPSQIITLGIGGGLSFAGVMAKLFPIALIPIAVAGVIAFKRVNGLPLHELIPLRCSWLLRRRHRGRHLRPPPCVALTKSCIGDVLQLPERRLVVIEHIQHYGLGQRRHRC